MDKKLTLTGSSGTEIGWMKASADCSLSWSACHPDATVGVVQQQAGHDRIDQLGGTSQRLPATTFAIALAGVALIGLPPSGAFLGKWHLLATSIDFGQWLLVLVMGIGSLLAAAYVFRVLGHAFGNRAFASRPVNFAIAEWPALALGMLATLGLGLGGDWLWDFLGVTS